MATHLVASEREVQRAILELLAFKHVFAFRLNTSATIAEHNGKRRFFRSHSLSRGAADILAFPWLKRVFFRGTSQELIIASIQPWWLEIKAGKGGKQSPEQKSFQEHVESLGHWYLVANSPDVVEAWLKEKGV